MMSSNLPRMEEEDIVYPNRSRRFPTFFELKQRRLKAEAVIQAALARIQAAEKRTENAIVQAQIEAAARAAAEERIRLLEEQLRQTSLR